MIVLSNSPNNKTVPGFVGAWSLEEMMIDSVLLFFVASAETEESPNAGFRLRNWCRVWTSEQPSIRKIGLSQK